MYSAPVVYTYDVYTPVDTIKTDNTEEPDASPEATALSVTCKCVTWLREVKGYNVRGDADTITPNTDEPIAGGVVLFEYKGVKHVAGIKMILLDRFIVEESNYEKCRPSERVIMKNDPHIVGYYFKNPNM